LFIEKLLAEQVFLQVGLKIIS